MALNDLHCAYVPLRNYSHTLTKCDRIKFILQPSGGLLGCITGRSFGHSSQTLIHNGRCAFRR